MLQLSNLEKKLKTLYAFFTLDDPKKYYWYQVRYIYNKNGVRKFDFIGEVGVAEQKTTLNRRELKRINIPLHKIKAVKPLLNNGTLDIEILSYLGYFSQ